jgi:hypothetical protein
MSMTLPILIPFVYFSHALNKVWRRHSHFSCARSISASSGN